jgi:hypothetical protein
MKSSRDLYTFLTAIACGLLIGLIASADARMNMRCQGAFGFVYGTKGRERLFFVGLFGFLLSPLKTLGPEWAVPMKDLEFFGITVSLSAALSLLLYPEVVGSAGTPNPPQS